MRFHLDVVKGREPPRQLKLDADSAEQATLHATGMGWTVLGCRSTSQWAMLTLRPSGIAVAKAKWSRATLTVFVEQLHALLQAGLSVIEALETLAKGQHGGSLLVLNSLISRLKEGQPLSRAMAQAQPFPQLLIAMVQSAEVTSDLPSALSRFLEHEKRTAEVRHQITSVALYPALLLLVGGGVMMFLLLYVMPRFARVFENMHDLPWSAQAMVTWSKLLKEHGWQLASGGLILVGLAAILVMTPSYRTRLMAGVLAYRPVAQRLRTYLLARWYRTIGMLVEGGIPLPEAIALANHVLPDALKAPGLRVEQGMREGLSPAVAFVKAGMTTDVAEQLLRAGERTGDVGLMLARSAEFHELEVTKALEKAMRIIEPVVMTLIGIGVGVIVILMYLPIFELAAAIQ
jgi:general secretion pathway protein F